MTQTQTTLEQQTARTWLKTYGQHNLSHYVLFLLRYLANNCYWQEPTKKFKGRRDFVVSQNAIARALDCSLPTVEKCIRESVDLGFVTVVKGEEGKSDAYALHLDKSEHYEGKTNAFRRSRIIAKERKEAQRVARNRRLKERRAGLAQKAAERPLFHGEEYAEGAGI